MGMATGIVPPQKKKPGLAAQPEMTEDDLIAASARQQQDMSGYDTEALSNVRGEAPVPSVPAPTPSVPTLGHRAMAHLDIYKAKLEGARITADIQRIAAEIQTG